MRATRSAPGHDGSIDHDAAGRIRPQRDEEFAHQIFETRAPVAAHRFEAPGAKTGPARHRNRGGVHDMARDPVFRLQRAVDPANRRAPSRMTPIGKCLPARDTAFSRNAVRQASGAAKPPPDTECRDIFSLPGVSDVISQVDYDRSNETKIAPRSTGIAAGGEIGSAVMARSFRAVMYRFTV